MASRRRRLNRIARRDHTPIANRRLVVRSILDAPLRPLLPLYDRRRYDPTPIAFRSAGSPRRKFERVEARDGRRQVQPVRYYFAVPQKVAVCVRRKERREVLFALNRTRGRGPKRRNMWSDVKCR